MFGKKGIPLYLQLKNKLYEDIKANYQPGDIIPPEFKLEQTYHVSRITVRRAIEELERENVVIKKQGRGTFVQEQKVLYHANSIGSLTQRLAKQKHFIKTKSMSFEVIERDHHARELIGCKKILCIRRFRYMDGVPFALMINYLNYERVPNLEEKFTVESLYECLKKEYDIEFYNAEETVGARAATKEEAAFLNIEEKAPVLTLHRLSYDKNNEAVEFSDIAIKADMYKHKIILENDKLSNI